MYFLSLSPAVLVIFTLLYLECTFALLATTFTDPGYLPTGLDVYDMQADPASYPFVVDDNNPHLQNKTVVINGVETKIKYCGILIQLYSGDFRYMPHIPATKMFALFNL